MNSKHTFCRHLLSRVLKEVKEKVPDSEIKTSWAYQHSSNHFEFHGPDGFFTFNQNADCLWSAKAEGWMKFLTTLK